MSEQQIQHDEELAQKEKIVREKEGTISRLNNQLLVSKQQVENRQIQEDSLNEEIVFKKIVDEVCNEQQDY